MIKYDVFILVHPPYFKFMAKHLESIKKALNGRAVKIFVFSSQTNEKEKNKLISILKKSKLDYFIESTELKSSIGASRNSVFWQGKAKYSIFLDADVLVEKDYFDNLDKCIKKYPSAAGFAAGIGTSHCSKYGIFEGAMDLRAYLRNLDLSKEEFNGLMKNLYFSNLILGKEKIFYKQAKAMLQKYEGILTRAFQGFNQIVKRKDLEDVKGFNETFWSAEDRELGIKFTLSGKKIIFTPSIWANHDYRFSLIDVLKRKRIHGIWYGELRKKYSQDKYVRMGFVKWFENFLFALNPPEPFRGLTGRIYCVFAFFSYFISSILSEKFSVNFTKDEKGGWIYGRDV